jgi:hypothetical protein
MFRFLGACSMSLAWHDPISMLKGAEAFSRTVIRKLVALLIYQGQGL